VLGGATLVMFGTVAAAGIRILASADLDRRDLLIMAVSFGRGLGVVAVPEITNSFSPIIKSIFSSSVTVAGLSAILMSLIIPNSTKAETTEQVSSDYQEANFAS
jgi:xanthine permease XanP